MRILAIETSCDESSFAILDIEQKDTQTYYTVRAHTIHSQIDIHQEFGGVFPALAKREHQKNLIPLFIKTLKDADMLVEEKRGISEKEKSIIEAGLTHEKELVPLYNTFLENYQLPIFDAITVTTGPGLEPALWVGVNFAKVLARLTGTPLVPVNHMEGHILSVITGGQTEFTLPQIPFPALALLISGGHTELVLMRGWGQYEILGKTLDDAVGEAFDKVARLLSLPYPGGPEVSKKAALAREKNIASEITLPRPMMHTKNYDFSFSGLKTAVLYSVKDKNLTEDQILDLCREFEQAVTDVLLHKTKNALQEYGIETLIIGGGVSANAYIRESFKTLCADSSIQLYVPSKDVTGDNALMIGIVGALTHIKNQATKKALIPLDEIKACGSLIF